jgi:hypothetical protein
MISISAERRATYSKSLNHGVFGVVPALAGAFVISILAKKHGLGADFAGHEWLAGHQILDGLTPYVNVDSPEVRAGAAYLHPAVAAVLMAPLSLMPRGDGAAIFAVVNMFVVALTLRILEVRDWRVYGPALLWAPIISGWQTANITLLLALGIAGAWRYRDNALVCGVAVGLIVAAKIFLWPVGLWLLGTRRYRAARNAALVGVAANAVAWAILGFDQLPRYIHLLQAASAAEVSRCYSFFALGLHHGMSRSVAYALGCAVAVVAAGTCVRLGRRGRDQPAMALSVAVCLLATPVIWLHYFALVLVPFAVARPRISLSWALPLLLLFPVTDPADWQVIVVLATMTLLVLTPWLPERLAFRAFPRSFLRSRSGDPLIDRA